MYWTQNKSKQKQNESRTNYKPKITQHLMHSGRRALYHPLCDSNGNDSMQGETKPFSLDKQQQDIMP